MYTHTESQTKPYNNYSGKPELGRKKGRSLTWVTVTHSASCILLLTSTQCKESLSQTSSLQTASKYSLWNAVLHLSNNTTVKHIHISDANQCRTVATSSRTSQCLPIPPASCDWPAQDEIDITGCIPFNPDCSAWSHTVWRCWEDNRREK